MSLPRATRQSPEATAAADLSNISAGTVTANYGSGNTTMSGHFGTAAITVAGGNMTIGTANVTGPPSFSVSAGAVLTGTAAKLTGLTASGAGTTAVTALEGTAAADFENITSTTFTANYASGDVEMTGADLGDAAITVAAGTMTIGNADTTGAPSFTVESGATVTGTAALPLLLLLLRRLLVLL